MWRRRLLILTCVGGLLLIAFFYRSFLPREPIGMEGFERIQEGMMQKDVERLLGGPPGNYASWQVTYHSSSEDRLLWMNYEDIAEYQAWQGNEAQIIVGFSAEGVAI